MKHVTIPGTFESLNKYIDACRGNGKAANRMKQKDQQYMSAYIRKQLKVPLSTPIAIHFHYYSKNRKVDPDNIDAYFRKVFLDALVKTGRITNDGWSNVVGFIVTFSVDARCSRVEADIYEDVK